MRSDRSLLDQLGGRRADLGGPCDTPAPVAGEEGLRLGRQMRRHGEPLAELAGAQVIGDEAVVLVDRDERIGRAQPQALADQREGNGVQPPVELDVAVAVHGDAMPSPEIRGDRWQRPQERALDARSDPVAARVSCRGCAPRPRPSPSDALGR